MPVRGLNKKLLSALIGALVSSGAIGQNLPVLSSVVSGSATTSITGSTLTVKNSASAILEWSKFSIASGFTTNFVQPSAASAVLNRVVGADPSNIFGSLISNGKVFLINPNGIVFGQGSQVNVGALVASTLALSNANFLAGNTNFGALSTAGNIDVSGSITAVDSIVLNASTINGSGTLVAGTGGITINSPTGTIFPGAGALAVGAGAGLSVNPGLGGGISPTGSGGAINVGTGIVVAGATGIPGTNTGSGAITLTALGGATTPGTGTVAVGTGGIPGPNTGSGAITLTAPGGATNPGTGIAVVAGAAGIPNTNQGKQVSFQAASANVSGITSAAQRLVLISSTATPGVQYVVRAAPTGALGGAINPQGQISLVGNRTSFSGNNVAVIASAGPDGMVRLTAKP